MNKTVFKTRKFAGEKYTFILYTPEYEGEKGCLGLELMPYITVETPENSFGYIDVFFYDNTNTSGHYANRSHPAWITKKIVEVCRKFAENLPYSVY